MLTALLTLPLMLQPWPVQDEERDALYERLQEVDRVTPVVAVVRAVTPSVVFIETKLTQRVNTFYGVRRRTLSGSGSGVVVHPDGYIVTNYHVVKGALDSINVSFDGDTVPYRAELVSHVQSEDLALLKIIDKPHATRISAPIGKSLSPAARPGFGPRTEGFPPARLGTSADLMPGETVIAIGNPYGQTHTVSTGIISGLHRNVPIPDQNLYFKGLIQTDASINFGNSGGPLLNVRGELIGINSAMNSQAENIGFAIPVDRVVEVLNEVLFPQARRSWLGFELAPHSLVVEEVWSDGPAGLAGVCAGDLVLALNGRPVASFEDFLTASLELEPGGRVRLALEREGQRNTASFESWDKVDGVLFQRLGLTVREERFRDGTYVIVDRVGVDSPAHGLGLRSGDLIPAIEPRVGWRSRAYRIRDRKSFYQVVSQLEPGVVIDVDVYRDENQDQLYTRDELYKGKFKVR